MWAWASQNPGYAFLLILFGIWALEVIFKRRYCACCRKPLNEEEEED